MKGLGQKIIGNLSTDEIVIALNTLSKERLKTNETQESQERTWLDAIG